MKKYYELKFVYFSGGIGAIPTATVVIFINGIEYKAAEYGIGVVDAIFKATDRIVGNGVEIIGFTINNTGKKSSDDGEAYITIKKDGVEGIGRGQAPDINIASAYAYIAAINDWEKNRDPIFDINVDIH